MQMPCARWYPALLLAALLAGCQEKPAPTTAAKGPETPPDPEAEIRASLANLGPEDQRLAERQKYCPVMPDIRLGEMGTPLKVELNGQAVMVCCKSCARHAQEEPEKTLAALKDLKEKATATMPK